MKKTLRSIFAAAVTLATAVFALPSQASHLQGAELTYTCIAPNTYVVNLKIYRDCTGAAAPTSASLSLRSPGCNVGRNQAMNKIPSQPGMQFGNFYCPQVGNVCTSTGRPNYEEAIFTTTVSFTTAEAQCADWTLSWSECCRPNAGNITNAQSFNLYAEAFLKLHTSGTPNINNSSPQFNNLVALIVNKFQPIVLSSNAVEADGDSLVYSLKPALGDATTPVQYGNFNSQGGIMVNPNDSTQIAFVPTGQQTFSPTFPIPSYQVDWSKPAPRYATQNFVFDPKNGSMMFTPTVYHSGATSVSGLNKYVVVVQVDEYRKINGNMLKIGSVRRDMFIMVEDCGPNRNPALAAPAANGHLIGPNGTINLRPGIPLSLTFAAADHDQTDVLKLESDAGDILPGAIFLKTSGNRPTGTVTWTPTTAHVRDHTYYFRVMVEDNACPVKGQHVETIGVRVTSNGRVTGTGKADATQAIFAAYPNPFSGKITFRIMQTQPQQQLLIYNVLGQQVDQIMVKGQLNTEQEITWLNASKFPAGQYIVRFSGAFDQSLKISKF